MTTECILIEDALSRCEAMTDDNGTWDLSDRDRESIRVMLAEAALVSGLRSALIDIILLCRRIARAESKEKRADLMQHVHWIGDAAGVRTATILRDVQEENEEA